MKHIMISIRPEYVVKILNREKILEIRKSIPKELLNGEECIVEAYCTKDQKHLVAPFRFIEGWFYKEYNKNTNYACGCTSNIGETINGKVVARWHLKKYDEFEVWSDLWLICDEVREELETIRGNSCLSQAELLGYLGKKDGYAWHIDNLEIYDKPKSLEEFGVKRPFQSWGYLKDEN